MKRFELEWKFEHKTERTVEDMVYGKLDGERYNSVAIFSPDRLHRYFLSRTWGEMGSQSINFIMLNPSTADATRNDPTVERCEQRARAQGFGAVVITNLFAFRATDPAELKRTTYPAIGPENDLFLETHAKIADVVVCGWGSHGGFRGLDVARMLRGAGVKLHYLKLSKSGVPWHPLYLPYLLTPQEWNP